MPVGEMGENAYEQLKIIHAGDGVETLADVQLQYCGGLGAFGLQGLFWSPNSRFFYYTDAREGVPDGCGYWEPPIISFDVTTQKKEYLGNGPRSPDGTKIAAWQNQELVIWDVNMGEIGRVAMRESGQAAGPMAWSSNSRALAYVRTTDPCPPRGKSYVGRIDLTELKQTILLASEAPSFEGVEWDGPNRLRLFDEEGKKWQYDFATHRLEVQR